MGTQAGYLMCCVLLHIVPRHSSCVLRSIFTPLSYALHRNQTVEIQHPIGAWRVFRKVRPDALGVVLQPGDEAGQLGHPVVAQPQFLRPVCGIHWRALHQCQEWSIVDHRVHEVQRCPREHRLPPRPRQIDRVLRGRLTAQAVAVTLPRDGRMDVEDATHAKARFGAHDMFQPRHVVVAQQHIRVHPGHEGQDVALELQLGLAPAFAVVARELAEARRDVRRGLHQPLAVAHTEIVAVQPAFVGLGQHAVATEIVGGVVVGDDAHHLDEVAQRTEAAGDHHGLNGARHVLAVQPAQVGAVEIACANIAHRRENHHAHGARRLHRTEVRVSVEGGLQAGGDATDARGVAGAHDDVLYSQA